MTRTEHAHLAVALAAVLGCQSAGPYSPPRPAGAEPAQGFERVATTIEIVGSAFYVRAVQRVDTRESSANATYRAWLGAFELEEVVWLGPSRLRARVPPGLPVGRHDVTVEGPYGRGSAAGAFEVLAGAPPVLSAAVTLPRSANVGQEVLLGVTADNGGDRMLQAVLTEVTLAGTGALAPVAAGAGDAPQDLAPGARGTFTVSYRAETPGNVSVRVSVLGSDPGTGATVAASAAGDLLVERPAALSASMTMPPGPLAIGDVPVSVTVTNTGEATALDVLPVALTDDGSTAGLVVVSAPSQPVALAGGESVTLTWACRVAAAGTLTVTATVGGVDANDGGVRTATATGTFGSIPHTAEVIAADPFADGSPFAFVAPLGGQVYVGPSRTGTGIIRMQLDGSAPESLSLSFWRDGTGSNTMGNTASPYQSIGFTGCQPDSFADACGPDDEDGRGLLTSVSFAGEEWLVLGGAKVSGGLEYVYLSRASSSPLSFSYVDLSQLLGANTRGFSAAFAHDGRLYLGFPDNGGNRPYGLALLTPPAVSGVDAVLGTHALDLNLHDAYAASRATFASMSMVDAIAELGGRLYFFNDAGCLVSTSSTPAAKADFRPCSPSPGAAYDQNGSVEPTQPHDLQPHDRAWPQVVAWQGRLYAIRNTYTGPQLWTCDPAGGVDPVACEATDWSLLAADPATLRTRLGNPAVTAASMLLATPTHLYIGLDDPIRGIHVFRTRTVTPGVSDFTGQAGCTAGTVGCEGMGGDGMGAPAVLTRIFDAKAVTGEDGRLDLFLTAGDGTAPVRLVRMDP